MVCAGGELKSLQVVSYVWANRVLLESISHVPHDHRTHIHSHTHILTYSSTHERCHWLTILSYPHLKKVTRLHLQLDSSGITKFGFVRGERGVVWTDCHLGGCFLNWSGLEADFHCTLPSLLNSVSLFSKCSGAPRCWKIVTVYLHVHVEARPYACWLC